MKQRRAGEKAVRGGGAPPWLGSMSWLRWHEVLPGKMMEWAGQGTMEQPGASFTARDS